MKEPMESLIGEVTCSKNQAKLWTDFSQSIREFGSRVRQIVYFATWDKVADTVVPDEDIFHVVRGLE